jgi:hypothetical protein
VSFLALVLCRCQEQAVLRFCVFTSASFDVGKNSIDIATFRNPNQGPNAPRKSYDLEFYITLWFFAGSRFEEALEKAQCSQPLDAR